MNRHWEGQKYASLHERGLGGNLKKIKAILEARKDGYGVSFEEIPNIFGFGENVEEVKMDARKAH